MSFRFLHLAPNILFLVAPSNYLKLVSTAPAGPNLEVKITGALATDANEVAGPQEFYPYKAEALYACELTVELKLCFFNAFRRHGVAG
jgi:hypothetical protein